MNYFNLANDHTQFAVYVIQRDLAAIDSERDAAAVEETKARARHDEASAALKKLSDGFGEVRAELDSVVMSQSADQVESRIVAGLMGNTVERITLAATEAELVAHRAYLETARTYWHRVLEPKHTLTVLEGHAGSLEATAIVATLDAVRQARLAYEAGQALREVEGGASLFPQNGLTAKKLAEACEAWKKAHEVATNCSRYADNLRKAQQQ